MGREGKGKEEEGPERKGRGRERTGEGEAKEWWKTCLHRFSLN